MSDDWLNQVRWDEKGLIPVIVQEAETSKILMFAWMNREALKATIDKGEATYWSRSKNSLWHKGDQSGHIQKVREVRLDCDQDVILLKVEQEGGIACHTGRHNCFFYKLEANKWMIVEPVIKDPKEIYRK